jgi:hypothetical protein
MRMGAAVCMAAPLSEPEAEEEPVASSPAELVADAARSVAEDAPEDASSVALDTAESAEEEAEPAASEAEEDADEMALPAESVAWAAAPPMAPTTPAIPPAPRAPARPEEPERVVWVSLAEATTPAPEGRALNWTPEVVRASPPAVMVVEPTAYPEVPPLMAEIPPAAAAASVAVELLSPVTVEVIMVVLEASLPLTAPEALSRTESALAPEVGEGEAEARASVGVVSY